jgi:acyl dehydratase
MQIANKGFAEFAVGQEATEDYVISPEVYEHFLAAFQDVNPLHVDEDFAQAHGFSRKVMHGSLLNGFISHFVGTRMPGARALLHSVAVEYRAPSYLGDRIGVQGKVVQKVESLHVLILALSIRNLTQGKLAAKAKIQVGFTS